MRLLYVIATPRGTKSNTLRVSDAFLRDLLDHRNDIDVEVVYLFDYDLPSVTGMNIETKYTLMLGQPIDRAHAASWAQIEALIERFLAADMYLIATPMWNLSIPYALKYYIDCIVQPGYLFSYNEHGQAVPLVLGKKMVVVTSRGGDYSVDYMRSFDFQEPYLRAIFGFIGITDIEFINVEPTDITPDRRESAVSAAVERASVMAHVYDWTPDSKPASIEHPTGLKPRPI